MLQRNGPRVENTVTVTMVGYFLKHNYKSYQNIKYFQLNNIFCEEFLSKNVTKMLFIKTLGYSYSIT